MRRELVSKLVAALPALAADLVFADIAAPLIERNILVTQEYRTVLNASSDSGRPAVLVDILAGKEDAAFDVFLDILRRDHPWLADEVLGEVALGDVTDSVPIPSDMANTQNMANQRLEMALEQVPEVQQSCLHRKRHLSSSAALTAHSKRIAQHHNAANASTCNAQEIPTNTLNDVQSTPGNLTSSELINSSIDSNKRTDEDSTKLTQALTEDMMGLLRRNHRTSRDWASLAHALGLSRLVNKIRVKVLVFGEDLDFCVVHLLQEWAGEKPKDANLKNLLLALRGEGFNDVADELVEKFAT